MLQATDTVLERSVAVKLLAEHLAEDEAFVARFRRGRSRRQRTCNANVDRCSTRPGSDGDRHYIVMGTSRGPRARPVRERKQLEVDETVQVVQARRESSMRTVRAWCTVT